MDKMIQKVMKEGEKVAPVKSIKVKFQKAENAEEKKEEVAKKMHGKSCSCKKCKK